MEFNVDGDFFELIDHFAKGTVPLKVDAERLSRWFREDRGPIYYLMFGITYECQLECPHCCVGDIERVKSKELTTEQIKSVLNQASQTFLVNFFGGEPTLRPDIMELIKYATTKSLYVFMDTNGILVTKDFARQLKESGLDQLYVSIDSPIPEKHDQLRGEGIFDKAVGAIKNALDVGLTCAISTYISHENLANGEFEGVIKLARDLNAAGVRYVPATPSGKWLRHPEVRLSPEEKAKVRELGEFPFVYRDFYLQNQASGFCRGQKNKMFMYISPYGDVQPCCFTPLTFGNVKDEPLQKLLDRMWGHPIFNHECMDDECPMYSTTFRKDYIDPIPEGTKLPFKMTKEIEVEIPEEEQR